MSAIIPITLVGGNLGKRHLYLNSLVNEAHKSINEDFGLIENIPEISTVDRLFKIELASKLKNVDYIIKNLKDDDMLYVSKALKSKWLIDNEEIINPVYLEDKMYADMIVPAKTKMQHWVHLNLKDERRCKVFYDYYKNNNFKLSLKFLVKCSKDAIQSEFPKVMHKINPNIFKVLCEKNSDLAKIFFDLLSTDEKLKSQYVNNEKGYFNTLKHLLKIDGDFVLDVYEKYFNKDQFRAFSPAATQYILGKYKNRFMLKPELYTVYLLHLRTLAQCLNIEENKELVIKLARAKYLSDWFSYKTVEPLIKPLKPEDRAEFKKKVFVVKDIGEEVENWPYPLPVAPEIEYTYYSTIFDDRQPDPESYGRIRGKKRMIKKKKGNLNEYCMIECCDDDCTRTKTLLDKLFDEFRFSSFGQTLYELRKRIVAESSPQNREFMLLVLISKTGGRPDAIASLLQLLAQHSNEPSNVRAAIIRSLVKRAQVWRLPEESWKQLLQFGQGLGLDGKSPDADCDEGLHAVVIRSLILTGKCDPDVQGAFLSKFCYFTDYKLSTNEKTLIASYLPKLILSVVKEKEDPASAVYWIEKLIETLNAFKIKLETYPGLIAAISEIAEKEEWAIAHLLINLFDSKVARKQLFRYTFNYIKTDASFVNALRHDPSVIDPKTTVEYFTDEFMKRAEQFFKKLSIYFIEENGLASKFIDILKEKGNAKEDVKKKFMGYTKVLGQPLAVLLGTQFESYLNVLNANTTKESKILSAALLAHGHLLRPCLDIEAFGWKSAGVKLVASKTMICRTVDIGDYIEKLLNWKRAARVALALSRRINKEKETFLKIADLRPQVAIKSGLKIIRRDQDNVKIEIWEKIKPKIRELDITNKKMQCLVKTLAEIRNIPLKIRAEYSEVIYTSFKKKSELCSLPPLCHLELLLPEVHENVINNILQKFLEEEYVKSNFCSSSLHNICLYIRILVKFLLLCKDVEKQNSRWKNLGEPFLAQLESIFKSDLMKNPEKKMFCQIFDEIFLTFKYSKVFLNPQYVSPLPVMENILLWIHKLFPLDRNFGMYVKLHLTMLLFKAMRQGVKLSPETFSDERKTRNEGVEIVGNIFGRYIAREVKTVTVKYFSTITELYAKYFIEYLEEYNNHGISSNLLSSILKGILVDGKGIESLVGVHLMTDKYSLLKDDHCKELLKTVKEIADPGVKHVAFFELFVL